MSKILFVLNFYPGPGGVESVSTNLIDALGYDNEIYLIAYEPLSQSVLPDRLKNLFYFEDKSRIGSQITNILQYNRIIADKKIDFVINQGMYPCLTDIVFNEQRDRSVKVISVLHGNPGYERYSYWEWDLVKNLSRLKWWKRRILGFFGLNRSYNRYAAEFSKAYRMTANESCRVVLLCDKYIDEFFAIYNIPSSARNKFIAIHNPLSETYSSIALPDFAGKENLIISLGRLTDQKNIPVMLDAWKYLYKRLPDWKFVIVGDGPLKKELEQAARDRHLENIEFAGYSLTPEEYYRKAKVILLTSRYEGYPMVLIEAQRYGVVPVAYISCGGVESILENGGGVIVGKADPRTFADSVYNVVSDKKRLEDLSASVYRKSEHNVLSSIAGQWRSLLSDIK